MWVPYRHLIHYVYDVARKEPESRGLSKDQVVLLAKRRATQLASKSLSSDFIDETYEWEEPRANISTSKKFSPRLINFLHRPHHKSRRALEKLLLAYLTSGFSLVDSVDQALEDYISLGDWILPLGKKDVFLFAALFWDWRLVPVLSAAQSEYARRILGPDERSIFFGDVSVDEIKIEVGARTSETLQNMILKIASSMGACIQKEMKRLIRDGNILHDSRPYLAMATLTASMQTLTRGALDLNESTGNIETLQSFIEQKIGDVDPELLDYSMQEGYIQATPELLQEINSRNNLLLIDPTKNDLT